MKLDVLAFAAHPDDTELSCAGTLAKLVKQGLKVGVVDLTQGEMGTRGTPELRLMEAQKAAEIIGLSVRDNLKMPDTILDNTRAYQLKIIEQIRLYKPDICFITAPEDRHPDHGKATRLLIDSLFYSGLRKIETTWNDVPQDVWRPHHVFHYMQDTPFNPDVVFDITETQSIKEEAILAFSSQFAADGDKKEPQTYISSNRFFEVIRARAKFLGHQIGADFGEGFKYVGGPLPLSSFDSFLNHKRVR
ncbi:bacillithiol biosynthesis deacetylase BshB1 [bacterium]|nr:MAG: bacillithiol biosynthesis deacetylase BshB1 [bacterium]